MTTPSVTTNQPQDDALLESACFPLGFHVDFYEFLHARRDVVEVLTYADMPWGDDWDYENNYPDEWRNWRKQLRTGERDPKKIYVFIQHDVDDVPERTLQLLREEERFGIRSTSLIFNFRLNQQVLVKEGIVVPKPYPLDDEYLRALEAKGWVIGYHSNAYDQSKHNAEEAMAIFERDVAELRERFNVDFFCPHGGTRDKEGRSNAVLEMPESLRTNLRWTLNRHTPKFDSSYSDGAINSWNKDAMKRDLRDFVRTWVPGGRYRILTHPQYYDHDFTRSRRLSGIPWYEEMVAGYEQSPKVNAWDGVQFRHEQSTAQIAAAAANAPDGPNLPGCPIFIGGDGRSGTTLLNVVLDSHPDLAVGPELHYTGAPNLGPGPLAAIRLLRKNDRRLKARNLTKNPEQKPFVQFVHRAQRAGLDLDTIEYLIRQAMAKTGSDLSEFNDRCELVHMFGEHLRTEAKKKRWGFKIMKEIKKPQRYTGAWPYAQFVHIIRDGRDVAASQINEHGGWGYADIEAAAEGWVNVIEQSRANAHGIPMHEIRYEDLVTDPEPALRSLLKFLNVKWNPAVLRHNEVDHAFFNSTVRHPSRAQTQRPINKTAVGRFRTDLTPKQIQAFESVAGHLLDELGYRQPQRTAVAMPGDDTDAARDAGCAVEFGYGTNACGKQPSCATVVAEASQRLVGTLIADGAPSDALPAAAVIELAELDASAIDSLGRASGDGEMTVRELTEAPAAAPDALRTDLTMMGPDAACPIHGAMWWGVFDASDRLLAYAALERVGAWMEYRVLRADAACDDENDAIDRLHRGILRWLAARDDARARGVRLLCAGRADAGDSEEQERIRERGFAARPLFLEPTTRDKVTDAENDRRKRGTGVDASLPIYRIDLQSGIAPCQAAPACLRAIGNVRERLVGRFIGVGAPQDGQVVAGVLDLRDRTYDEYFAATKKAYKGAAIRQAKKAAKQGFICKPFARKLHIPDIVEINHSKEERCGKPMRASYLKSVEEMGGPPKKHFEVEPPACPRHFDWWWGVFEPREGYTQGDIVTNERLIGYVDLRRNGNFGLYSLILGHGDYLKYGIMFQLHFAIMERILARQDAESDGLDYLMYAGFYQGGDGLIQWKKKAGFTPGYFVIDQKQIDAIDRADGAPAVRVTKGLRKVAGRLRRAGKRLRDVALRNG